MRKRISLLLLSLLAGTLLSGASLTVNSGFEEKDARTGFAFGWRMSPVPGKPVEFTLDDSNPGAGKYSARIEVKEAPGKSNHSIFQRYRFPELKQARECRISMLVCGVGIKNALIVTKGDAGTQKQAVWKKIAGLQGDFNWKTVSGTVTLPAGLTTLELSIRMTDTGTLWIDNVAVEIDEETPVSAVAPAVQKQEIAAVQSLKLDFNGEIVQETGLPGNWTLKAYLGNENVSTVGVERDGDRICAVQRWSTGAARSGFTAALPATWSQHSALRLSGAVRCEGDGKAAVGLEFFDAHAKSLGEVLAPELSGSSEWQKFDTHFAVPKTAVSTAVILLNTGMGTVRFDGVTVNSGDLKSALHLTRDILTARVYPVVHSREQQETAEPEFNTFADSPTKLTFHFMADKDQLKAPALLIDLPAEVKIVDAVCPHPVNWRQEKFTSAPLKRPEGDYRRWRFERPRGMLIAARQPLYQRRLVMLLMPEEPGKSITGEKVFWHLENDGRSGPEEWFRLNILPAMVKTPNPKRFAFFRWNDEDLTFGNREAFLASLRCQEEAGYTWCARYDQNYQPLADARKILAERGWTFMLRGAPNGAFRWYAGLKEMKVPSAMKADGKVQPGHVCPSFLVYDPEFRPIRDRLIRDSIAGRAPMPGEYIIMDSEEWHPMDWCFCERCRRYFSEKQKSDHLLTAAEIRRDHKNAWREFRVELAAGQVEMVEKIAREFKLKVGDYNYVVNYSAPDYRSRYFSIAKDAQMNEAFQDMHLPSYYHYLDAVAFDMIRIGRQSLTKPYYPICAVDGSGSYLSPDEVLTPARFRLMLLTAAVDGCPGFAIYPGERLDGKFYLAADQAMAEVARLEEFFLDGQEQPGVKAEALELRVNQIQAGGKTLEMSYPGWQQHFRFNAREYGGKQLISLLNYHPTESAWVRISLPEALGKRGVSELVARQKLILPENAKEFLVEVPPRDARFVLLGEAIPEAWNAAPSQRELEQRHRIAADKLRADTALVKPWKSGNFELSYDDPDGSGVPIPVLSNANQKLHIDLANGGTVMNWTVNGVALCPNRKNGQLLAENRIWLPKNLRSGRGGKNASRLSTPLVASGRAELQLEHTWNGLSLKTVRTYAIPENVTEFEVTTTHINTGKQSLELAFWVRNMPNPEENGKALPGKIEFSSSGQWIAAERSLTDVRIAVPGGAGAPDDGRSFQKRQAADTPELRESFGDHAISYRPDARYLTAFQLYNGSGASTVEWHYRPVTLKPGEKVNFKESFQIR